MLAVMILALIVQALILYVLLIVNVHLANIAGALGHIAQTFSAPAEMPDEERR